MRFFTESEYVYFQNAINTEIPVHCKSVKKLNAQSIAGKGETESIRHYLSCDLVHVLTD